MTVKTMPWSRYARLPQQTAGFTLQQYRGCPLNGSTAEQELFRIDDFQFFNDIDGRNRIVHRVVYNQDSGLLYTNPCYTPEGFAFLFEKAGQSYGHSEGRMEEQVAWVLKHHPKAQSVCDIGCGNGAFLQAMPQSLTRTGIDIDAVSIQKAQENAVDISFHCMDFMNFPIPGHQDLITMFHVLEHLPTPLETLKNLRQTATQDTRLVVEVPIVERVCQQQNEDLVGFFTVQHLTHFSKPALHAMLKQSGWHGIVTEETEGYNGYRVLAAPGPEEKALLTVGEKQTVLEQAKGVLQQWGKNRQRITQHIEAIPSHHQVLVWGAGQHTEYLDHFTPLFQKDTQFLIVDKDPLKAGTLIHGIPVLTPDEIPAGLWQSLDLSVVVSSYAWQSQISEMLLGKGVPPEALILLYDHIHQY